MVLDAAVSGRADALVTRNLADFAVAAPGFGLVVPSPGRVVDEDEHMSKAAYVLKLPASVRAAAAQLAKEDGASLTQWIAAAVAQKVGAVETAAEFFRRRGDDARVEDLQCVLETVPDREPDLGDELPAEK